MARAINGTEPMTVTATPEELQAYQYKLARIRRELEKQKNELDMRQESASASSRRRAELSRQSGTSGDSHRAARNRARSQLQNIPEADRENLVQNLDMSFMSIDTGGILSLRHQKLGTWRRRLSSSHPNHLPEIQERHCTIWPWQELVPWERRL